MEDHLGPQVVFLGKIAIQLPAYFAACPSATWFGFGEPEVHRLPSPRHLSSRTIVPDGQYPFQQIQRPPVIGSGRPR